jgi:hypothetical protein
MDQGQFIKRMKEAGLLVYINIPFDLHSPRLIRAHSAHHTYIDHVAKTRLNNCSGISNETE